MIDPRRLLRRSLGHGRWIAGIGGLSVLVVSLGLARQAAPALPAVVPAACLAAGLPALVLPWRWLGTLLVLAVTATHCLAVVVGGNAARPWVALAAAMVLAAVLVAEPLERPGEVPPPVALAVESWWARAGIPALALALAAGVGWVAAARATPSALLVSGGLAAGVLALAVVLHGHRPAGDPPPDRPN